MKLKAILSVLLATIIVLASIHAVHQVNSNNQLLHLKEIKLRNIQSELKKLDSDYQQLQQDHTKTVEQKNAEIKALQKKETELQKQITARRLLKQQEARAYAATQEKARAASVRASYDAKYSGTGSSAMDWIVQKESGGNPYAINSSSGACGLFQALPCSKLLNVCGSLSNVSCQIQWGKDYAIGRYGSYSAAQAFWISHKWW
jgi:hypothetical protein